MYVIKSDNSTGHIGEVFYAVTDDTFLVYIKYCVWDKFSSNYTWKLIYDNVEKNSCPYASKSIWKKPWNPSNSSEICLFYVNVS